jgi:hypothetical protein
MRYRKLKINGRTVYEHRHVVEGTIGRPLARAEVVHHKNHDKLDNRSENLEITSPREHAQHHMLTKSPTTVCVICSTAFAPPTSHRERDRTCSAACKHVLLIFVRVGDRIAPDDIQAVRRRHAGGESLRSIGRSFRVTHRTISKLVHLPPPLAEAVARAVLAQVAARRAA